jgi:hypothetical protein
MPQRLNLRFLLLLAVTGLAACSHLGQAAPPLGIADSPWATSSAAPAGALPAQWAHQVFPGKRATSFQYVRLDGRDAIAVLAQASASMLRQPLRLEPAQLGQVHFSWKVPALMDEADLALRSKADAVVRVVLMFEGDRSRFSAADASLSELSRAVMGEELPYATLMYVWSSQRPPGTVIPSTRTSRIRKLVVESGSDRLGRWMDYQRDVRADYLHAFGEPPGALVGVGIMTDSDNTKSHAQAWYGPVRLVPPQP